MNPKIDSEFRALIPALSDEERTLLEENIVKEGCRDPLVIWAVKNILLDGHTRYEICTRRGIDFKTAEIELPDREAAADWIDANQLGRRNLKPDQMKLLIGRRYNRAKGKQGGDHKSKDQNDTLIDTAERLSKEHGVSAATVKRAAAFAEAVEKVKAIDPEIEQKIMAGTAPAKATVVEAAKLVEKEPETAKCVLGKGTRPRLPDEPVVISNAELTNDSERLQQLKYHWRRASKIDKAQFLAWVGAPK